MSAERNRQSWAESFVHKLPESALNIIFNVLDMPKKTLDQTEDHTDLTGEYPDKHSLKNISDALKNHRKAVIISAAVTGLTVAGTITGVALAKKHHKKS